MISITCKELLFVFELKLDANPVTRFDHHDTIVLLGLRVAMIALGKVASAFLGPAATRLSAIGPYSQSLQSMIGVLLGLYLQTVEPQSLIALNHKCFLQP
jgi:hypothetical protein